MLSREKFEDLLSERSEGIAIDFKRENYLLNDKNKDVRNRYRTSFVKDIITLANTPRDGSAYLILGVENTQIDGVFQNKRVGVQETIDDNFYQQILDADVIPCPPRLTTHIVEIDNLTFVVLEIGDFRPTDGPFTSKRSDGEKLKPSIIYYRNGSRNSEAKSDAELQRIYEWFQDGARDNRRSWEMFLEGMHNFEKGRSFILITTPIIGASSLEKQSLAFLPFFAVLDFDPLTDTESGTYNATKDLLRKQRSSHLHLPDDKLTPIIGNNTYWIAASGLGSDQVESKAINRRSWIRDFKFGIDRQIEELGKILNPKPVTCLIFCYDRKFNSDLFEPVLDQITAVFGDRIDFLFASDASISIETLAEKYYDRHSLNIPFSSISAGISERFLDVSSNDTVLALPSSYGNSVYITQEEARWLEEHLEIVYSSNALIDAGMESPKDFLRGAEISWNELDARFDAERDKTNGISSRAKQLLEQRDTARIQLFYPPGSGGTTVGKRVIWDLHNEFPSVVLNEAKGADTVERINFIREKSRLSVLVLIDSPSILRHQIDEIRDIAQSSGLPMVMLIVERQISTKIEELRNRFTIDRQLNNREIFRFYQRFIPYANDMDSKKGLEKLKESPRGNQHTPFIFGFTTFGRDYRRIDQYIHYRLEGLSDTQKKAVGFLTIAHHFGGSAVDAQNFASMLGLPRSKVVNLQQAFSNSPDTLELLIGTENNHWRTSNEILEEEILRQLLWPESSNRDNWRQRLSDWLIEFIEFCRGADSIYSTELRNILATVLVNRGNEIEIGTEKSGNNAFSVAIEKIPSREGQFEVLRNLAEQYPEEPHFQAHFGRFLSIRLRDFDRAVEVLQDAIKVQTNDNALHHMLGMAYRAKAYEQIEKREEIASIEVTVKAAQIAFEESREINPENEHGHISEAQMLVRLMDYAGRPHSGGFIEYIEKPSASTFIRDCYDQVEYLLERVRQNRQGEGSSEYERETRASLDAIFNRHERALQVWDNLRTRPEIYRPGINRKIIHTYLAQHERVWGNIPTNKIQRIVSLLNENLEAEPNNGRDLNMWVRAVRLLPSTPSIENVIERVSYWKTNATTSTDAIYYLYVHYAILAIEGGSYAFDQYRKYVDELQYITRTRKNRFVSLEWLSVHEKGIPLIHKSELGEWDEELDFWEGANQLRRVKGRISSIKHGGQGIIDLNGVEVMFAPNRGGFMRDRSENETVNFYLGFSYNGPYAWSVSSS
jgi:tetratricopeptide (TPR) repeat protein